MLTDTLRRIGHGHFMSQLDEASAECARAANQGGAATLTIKITYKTSAAGALNITGEHAKKLPKTPPLSALMWPTESGDLLPSDPRQRDLPLQVVPPQSGAMQSVFTPETALRQAIDMTTGEIRQA